MARKTILFWALLAAVLVWWYSRPQGMRHRGPQPPLPARLSPAAVAEVGRSYDRDIKPIFQGACFDCHTTTTVWPWYHSVPGVRQFLDGHVEEGRRALDMSAGFPFVPGPKVLRKLRGIAGNVQRGSMPLASYKLMHPLARLTDAQRGVIVRWAQDSYALLTATARWDGDSGAGR